MGHLAAGRWPAGPCPVPRGAAGPLVKLTDKVFLTFQSKGHIWAGVSGMLPSVRYQFTGEREVLLVKITEF
eukprot:3155257-Pyramimonas_sp.AAC.1